MISVLKRAIGFLRCRGYGQAPWEVVDGGKRAEKNLTDFQYQLMLE